jgi:hypothetical protein
LSEDIAEELSPLCAASRQPHLLVSGTAAACRRRVPLTRRSPIGLDLGARTRGNGIVHRRGEHRPRAAVGRTGTETLPIIHGLLTARTLKPSWV